LIIMSTVYFLLLLMYGAWLLNFLYSGKYQDYIYALFIIGLSPFFHVVAFVLGTALRVTQRLKQLLFCHGIAIFINLTLGLWFIISWEVIGSSIGFVISTATTAILIAVFYSFMEVEET